MTEKFKLYNSITKELIGYEYLLIEGWHNNVFDFGEREGVFNWRELGDGFLGVVIRKQFTGLLDANDTEIYDGDQILVHQFTEEGGLQGAREGEVELQGIIKFDTFGLYFECEMLDFSGYMAFFQPHDEWLTIVTPFPDYFFNNLS